MTQVRVITPPEPLVELEEAKVILGFAGTTLQNERIQTQIAAAQSEFDGPNGWVGRAIGEQVVEVSFPGFCREMEMPLPDVLGDVLVVYVDSDGTERTADEALYTVDGNTIRLAPGQSWPDTNHRADAVRIRYKAGLAEDDPRREQVRLAIFTHLRMSFDMKDPDVYERAIRSLLSNLVKVG